MKPSEILREAKSLIDAPEKWCQDVLAMNSVDMPVMLQDPSAAKRCTTGAIMAISDTWNGVGLVAYGYLERLMGANVATFNDAYTHSEVMTAWDKAIVLAEKDEGDHE